MTGAETARDAGADLDLGGGQAVAQCLGVGVDGDELDALEPQVDHRVDGVATRATDADHLDASVVGHVVVSKFDRKTHCLSRDFLFSARP